MARCRRCVRKNNGAGRKEPGVRENEGIFKVEKGNEKAKIRRKRDTSHLTRKGAKLRRVGESQSFLGDESLRAIVAQERQNQEEGSHKDWGLAEVSRENWGCLIIDVGIGQVTMLKPSR